MRSRCPPHWSQPVGLIWKLLLSSSIRDGAEGNLRPRSQNYDTLYLPFQFGVRLLRKASIPSRKSSLI